MDQIFAGTTDVSVLFALQQAGLTVTEFRASYTRWTEGDGTSFATATNALTALASITTAHTDNKGIYLSATATDGAKFLFRCDFPDAAFAAGADRVICSLYDDNDEIVAHRIFSLKRLEVDVKEINNETTIANNLKRTLYPQNAVYIDTVNGAAGTTDYENGTVLNPCSTLASAKTIADSLGLSTFIIQNQNSAITLGASYAAGYSFIGQDHAEIDLSGQDVGECYIENMYVTGTGTMASGTANLKLRGCRIINSALPDLMAWDCLLEEGISLSQDGDFEFVNCKDARANTNDLEIDFGAAVGASKVLFSDFAGEITVKNMDTGDTLRMTGCGKVTFDNTNTAGTAEINGDFEVVNNGTATVNINQSSTIADYEGGAIWVDTNNGTAGTQVNINGTKLNPVDTWADALTLSASLGITRFRIKNGSSITLTGAITNYEMIGDNWTLALAGQDISGAYIKNCRQISGNMNSSTTNYLIEDSYLIGSIMYPGKMSRVGINGPLIKGNGEFHWHNCFSQVDNTNTVTFDAGSTNPQVIVTGWSGRFDVQSMAAGDDLQIYGEGRVSFDVATGGGSLRVAGNFEIDDASGNVTITDLGNISGVQGKTAGASTYDRTTDSNEAIRDTLITNVPDVISLANINAEVDTALSDIKLDHLIAVADSDDPVDNSIIAKLVDNTFGTADWSNYNNNLHSLKGILERGDEAWKTGGGGFASASYTTSGGWTRVTGDNDGGAGSDTLTVNGSYFSTGEVSTGDYLDVTAEFDITDGELGVSADIWGFYAGGGGHYLEVQAYNYDDSTYEPLGNITSGSVVQKYTFTLSPGHTDTTNDKIKLRFLHRGGTGVVSHVFSIDKAQVNTAVPVDVVSDVNITQWDGNAVTGDGDWAELQAAVDAILVDTDEIQGKLPDNYIMGSGVTTDKDDEIDAILVDTANMRPKLGTFTDLGDGATVADNLTSLAGKTASAASYDRTTDSQEAIRDRGDVAWSSAAMHPDVLEETTIATLASQTSFTLTAGSADDDAYNGAMVVVTDSITAVQKAVGVVSDYTGATKTVTLVSDPGIFTMAVGDSIAIIAKKDNMDANIISVNGETTNDGVDWDVFFKKAQAVLFGKTIRSSGNFKYRDQADSIDLVDYDVSATGRIIN